MNEKMSKMSHNKQLVYLIIPFISICIAISFFYRYLRFNLVTLVGKILIFLPLLIFFIFFLSFFQSQFENFFRYKHKRVLLLTSILIVCTGFYFLPYQYVPFRTTHSLSIHVPKESPPVTLVKVTNTYGDIVSLQEFGFPNDSTSRLMYPGQTYYFSKSMTGGLSIFVRSEETPSRIEINWDGENSRYEITRSNSLTEIITNGSTWGVPEKRHIVLALMNLISDGVTSVFIMLFIFTVVMELFKRKQSLTLNDHQGWLNVDYKILAFQLLMIVVTFFAYRLDEFSSFLPILIMSASLILWIFTILKNLFNKNYLIYFLTLLSLISISSNFWLFPRLGDFGVIKIRRIDYSMSDLIKIAWPDTSAQLSVGFYKQLDEVNILITQNLINTWEIKIERLEEINHLKSIRILEYNDTLSEEMYVVLISDENIKKSVNRNIGSFYLLDIPESYSKTFQIYQYANDIFLLPEGYTK